jgi:hypothetical protein
MLCMDLWWFMDFRDINDIKPLFYGSNSRGSWKSSPPSLAAAKMEPVLLPYTLGIKLGKRKSIFWLENMRKSPIHGGSMKILHKLDSPLPCLTGRGYIIYENRASTNNNGAMIQQCVCVLNGMELVWNHYLQPTSLTLRIHPLQKLRVYRMSLQKKHSATLCSRFSKQISTKYIAMERIVDGCNKMHQQLHTTGWGPQDS